MLPPVLSLSEVKRIHAEGDFRRLTPRETHKVVDWVLERLKKVSKLIFELEGNPMNESVVESLKKEREDLWSINKQLKTPC